MAKDAPRWEPAIMHFRTTVVHCAIVFVSLAAGSWVRADFYSVRDLGVLNGGSSSQGLAINAGGVVAGSSEVTVGTQNIHHAVLFSAGMPPSDLASTQGTQQSSGRAINDGGAVAGSADTAGGTRAARFSGGGVTFITMAPGAISSQGNGIDASGNVVGSMVFAGGVSHGFRSNAGGGMNDLGLLTPLGSSEALGTNASGVAVGFATDQFGRSRAVVAQPGGTFSLIAALLPGGSTSAATAVSSLGEIVGFADIFGIQRAVRLRSDNTWQDLGSLGNGLTSRANAINRSGVIVGQGDSGGSPRAVVTNAADTGLVDLNTLIDVSLGWTLISATGINDQGLITGVGQFNGQDHAFLLVPSTIPEPASIVLITLGGLGSMGIARWLRPGPGRSTGQGAA